MRHEEEMKKRMQIQSMQAGLVVYIYKFKISFSIRLVFQVNSC